MVWVVTMSPLLHVLVFWFVRVSGSGISLDFNDIEWLPLILLVSYPFLLATHGTIIWIASRFHRIAFRVVAYALAWSLLALLIFQVFIVNWPDYEHRNDSRAMMDAYRDVVASRMSLSLYFCLPAFVAVAALDWSRTAFRRKRRA